MPKIAYYKCNQYGQQITLGFRIGGASIMAVPRIFISSTCYDLQEIRFQLRSFIKDMGYDPVMSEFGDIFYEFDKHVQDACKEEISKSNIFILIVGNNYGSLYHHHADKAALPDSVTLQEFRKALAIGVPKFIFLNRFVQHDFENYKRALSKQLTKHFSEHKVDDDDVEKTRAIIKEKFDSTYPFPQDAYRYIFYFLEMIYGLDINNAVFPFESFEEIKDVLRKQWAGFFFEALTKEKTIAIEKVELLGKKLERIEHQLRLLAESSTAAQDNNKRTIDVKRLASEFDIADLEQVQQKIDEAINIILYTEEDDWAPYERRFTLYEYFDIAKASNWLTHMDTLIQDYKWSKHIPITEIMQGLKYKYWTKRANVPYKSLFELCGIFNGLDAADRDAFLNTISLKLNELYEPEPEPSDVEPF